jgi:hypothetical protein
MEHENLNNQESAQLDIADVSGSTDWKKPLINRVKYELRRYTELAKRMDELMHECNLKADYSGAKEAEIKRNCYNRFVNDLKQLAS